MFVPVLQLSSSVLGGCLCENCKFKPDTEYPTLEIKDYAVNTFELLTLTCSGIVIALNRYTSEGSYDSICSSSSPLVWGSSLGHLQGLGS